MNQEMAKSPQVLIISLTANVENNNKKAKMYSQIRLPKIKMRSYLAYSTLGKKARQSKGGRIRLIYIPKRIRPTITR